MSEPGSCLHDRAHLLETARPRKGRPCQFLRRPIQSIAAPSMTGQRIVTAPFKGDLHGDQYAGCA